MAKFAYVGYGRDGRGIGKTEKGYTYVVNDTVRTGDVIQPVATSRKQRKFVTTGKVNGSYKQGTVKGIEAKRSAEQNGAEDITKVYSGKELGASGSKVRKPSEQGLKPISEYSQQTRAGNIAMQMKKDPNTELTEHAQETYAQYAQKFIGEEEQK